MTVADNTSRNQYTATSGQALFAYTFEIVDKDDIVVLINGTPLSEGTDYTVTGVGSDTGGNIVLTSGTTGGNIVTIYRDMAYERTQNYTNSGDFLASEVNSDFDRLWLAGEQTDRAFSQSIRKPITDSDSISMELPEAASRASKFLKFDANGAVDLAAGVTTDVDADDVSIADAGGYYTSDNVEGALQEIGAQPPGFDPNTDSFNIGSDAVSSGTDSIALGHDASATAARDIALGFDAVASGGGSIAIGQETDSTGVRSIAIGKGAQSTFSTSIALGEDASTLGGAGGSPVAIGYNASSTGTSGISLGPNTTASGSQSVSIGDSVSATGSGSTAIGQNASVTGSYSTALGFGATVTASTAAIAINDATASGVGSMAIHDNALSSGSYSMAIGYQSQATVGSAMAVGYSSQATAESSTALGHDASATGDKSIAIGFESYASFVDSIAIGNDTRSDALGSIAIGTGSDASQLGSVALGKGAQATGAGSTIAIGEAATTSGGLASPIAIGYQANTTGAYGVGLGYQTVTSGAQSIAIGYIASATNDNGIAIGRQLTVAGQKAVGIGWGVVAGDNDSIGIGTSANALTIDCISIGAGSESTSTGGVAIGGDASVTGNLYGVAVGYNATASEIGGVAIGHNALCESQFGMALGRDSSANAGGGYAVALGYGANANSNGTAINNADATGQRSIAISYNALASGDDSIAIGYNADALFDDAIAIGNVAGADAANTIHINASGVDTNQPQTAGYIVIETDDASLKYDGSWSLTGGPLNLSGGIDVTGSISADGLTVDGEGRIEETGAAARFIVSRTDALNVAETASIDLLEGSAGGSFGSANNYGFSIDLDGSNNTLNVLSGNQTAVTKRLSVARDTGDISFYEDTGTTASLVYTAASTALKLTGREASRTSGAYAFEVDNSAQSSNLTTSGAFNIKGYYGNSLTVNGLGDVSFYDDSGTAKFFWDASTERLGIGNAAPTTALDVSGTVTADGLTVDGQGKIQGEFALLDLVETDITDRNTRVITSGGKFRIDTVNDALSSSTKRIMVDHFTGDISFYDSSGTSQSLFWDASAERLGLGLTNPSQLLHLKSSGPDTYIQLGNNTVNAGYIGYNSAGDLNFWTNASTRAMTIDSSSNVGIGTDSPESRLSVLQSAIDGNALVLPMADTATDENFVSIRGKYGVGNEYCRSEVRFGVESFNVGSGFLSFATGTNTATERMRIDSTGNLRVGVGNTFEPVMQYTNSGRVEGNPGFTFSGDLDTGMFNPSTQGTIAFSNNGSESMRIDSSGHLLVGTDTYGYAGVDLTVGDTADSQNGIGIQTSTTGVGYILFGDGTGADSYRGQISYKHGDDYLAMNTAGTERMRIDSSGHLIVPNGVTLGTAVGTYAAANTLDDYEEGTFTPVLADASSGGNTATIANANGWYTKVGNLVNIGIRLLDINTAGLTASNAIFVRDLPFASSTTSYGNMGSVLLDRVNFTGYVAATQVSNTSYILLQNMISGSQDANLLVSDITSTGSDILISIRYKTT